MPDYKPNGDDNTTRATRAYNALRAYQESLPDVEEGGRLDDGQLTDVLTDFLSDLAHTVARVTNTDPAEYLRAALDYVATMYPQELAECDTGWWPLYRPALRRV